MSSKPPRRPRSRAWKPAPEALEARQLLAKAVTGMDVDGDTWSLRLIGPGDLRVVKQNGAGSTTPAPLNSATEINTIEVGGADPLTTVLVGQVTKGPQGDGKVFFQNLREIGGSSQRLPANNGIRVIDMPGFWLGNTSGQAVSATNQPGAITIPDGVTVLRFGGVDTTHGPQSTATATTPATPNSLNVNLGMPFTIGTSIIIDQSISSAAASQSQFGGGSIQNGVTFTTVGRLNLFEANQIIGSTQFPFTGFGPNPTTGSAGGGGTLVFSVPNQAQGVTGQIGDVRVGGNATDFGVQTNDKVSNFYIGGETNHVFVLAPGGSRNLYFGKGMDTVTVNTHTLENLQANRGALNSTVLADRSIGRLVFGGDVVSTTVRSGLGQNLSSEFSNQAAPTTPPQAQDGGAMTVLVAGDVTNSVFAASAQPLNNVFGANDLNLPHGHIDAKVEGNINNATATPTTPTTAFFAQQVHLTHGPVIPPVVPEPPFTAAIYHNGQSGLAGANALLGERTRIQLVRRGSATGTNRPTGSSGTGRVAAASASRGASVPGGGTARVGQVVPRGPAGRTGSTAG